MDIYICTMDAYFICGCVMKLWSANIYLQIIMYARLNVNAKCYLLMYACVKCQSRMLFAMVSTKLFFFWEHG
jgi:hypothetical protein